LCEKNTEFFAVNLRGTYSYHWALKVVIYIPCEDFVSKSNWKIWT